MAVKSFLLCLLAASALFPAHVMAQSWPAKSIRIVAPFAPGGTADTFARILAAKFGESFGQTVVVDNRAGAGGMTGSDFVAKSAPDGHTLVISGVASHAIAPAMSAKAVFDPIKDFSHIALLGGPPAVFAVHPSLPSRDLKSLIALAKAKPGQITYGSPGAGTQGHLVCELFKQVAGINLIHVPYKGASGAVSDLVAGHILALSTTLTTANVAIRAGRVRALAVSSAARVPEHTSLPTFRESGYPDLVATVWFALSGPSGMPADLVTRLNAEVRRVLQLPDVRERLRIESIEPSNFDVRAFNVFMASEVKRWAPVVRSAGVQLE